MTAWSTGGSRSAGVLAVVVAAASRKLDRLPLTETVIALVAGAVAIGVAFGGAVGSMVVVASTLVHGVTSSPFRALHGRAVRCTTVVDRRSPWRSGSVPALATT